MEKSSPHIRSNPCSRGTVWAKPIWQCRCLRPLKLFDADWHHDDEDTCNRWLNQIVVVGEPITTFAKCMTNMSSHLLIRSRGICVDGPIEYCSIFMMMMMSMVMRACMTNQREISLPFDRLSLGQRKISLDFSETHRLANWLNNQKLMNSSISFCIIWMTVFKIWESYSLGRKKCQKSCTNERWTNCDLKRPSPLLISPVSVPINQLVSDRSIDHWLMVVFSKLGQLIDDDVSHVAWHTCEGFDGKAMDGWKMISSVSHNIDSSHDD